MSAPVATWVQAIGSAGSLLGFASYVWIMLLNRRDEEEVRHEERAQAVSTWLDEGSRHRVDTPYVLCVHNAGTAPVYRCEVRYRVPDGAADGAPADSQDPRGHRRMMLHLVPPDVTAVRGIDLGPDTVDAEDLFSAGAVPQIDFTDSSSRHWRRDTDGVLHRMDRRNRIRRRARTSSNGDQEAWERSG